MSLASTQVAINTLRQEVEAIASTLAVAAPPVSPVRLDGDCRIWVDTTTLRVHTVATPDGSGLVFLSAGDRMPWRSATGMQWAPDWAALTSTEARELAMALLAAAGDA